MNYFGFLVLKVEYCNVSIVQKALVGTCFILCGWAGYLVTGRFCATVCAQSIALVALIAFLNILSLHL